MFFAAATEPGSAETPNEDWAGAAPGIAVVIDGITIPNGAASACHHGTPWYVNQLGLRIMTTASDPGSTLQDALSGAIAQVSDLHSDVCDLSKIESPSAAVAIVRGTDGAVDYLVLADVTVGLGAGCGLNIITDDRVERTVEDLVGQRGNGAKILERRLRYRNRKGGYWVAAADPGAAEHAITGSVPRSEFQRAVLMTDGVSRVVSVFAMVNWEALFNLAFEESPNAVIRFVREIEAGDVNGTRWPRFKCSDDATLVVIESSRAGRDGDHVRRPQRTAHEGDR